MYIEIFILNRQLRELRFFVWPYLQGEYSECVSERKLAAGSFWHPVDMLRRIGEMLREDSREDTLLEKGFLRFLRRLKKEYDTNMATCARM